MSNAPHKSSDSFMIETTAQTIANLVFQTGSAVSAIVVRVMVFVLVQLSVSLGRGGCLTYRFPSPTMFLPAGGTSRSRARRSRGNPQGKQRMDCGRK
jgi:hypothetical protein